MYPAGLHMAGLRGEGFFPLRWVSVRFDSGSKRAELPMEILSPATRSPKGITMGWVYECRKVQTNCSYRSESVGSREDAKKLGIIHLKNVHRIAPDQNWERLVEGAIR